MIDGFRRVPLRRATWRLLGGSAGGWILLWGCSPTALPPQTTDPRAPGCVPLGPARSLPAEIRESSGLAWSGVDPDLLWTHNDSGGEAVLFGVRSDGTLVRRVPVRGASLVDWEDLEAARCEEGSCLWIADTGDNGERRRQPVLYQVPEPDPEGSEPVTATVFPIEFPDGPRDVEALFLLPGEGPYLITKGRNHPVTLYRYPLPLRSGERVRLEAVGTLGETVPSFGERVTGAGADPEGRFVAVRSLDSLFFLTPRGGGFVSLESASRSLRALEEPQGEAVAAGPDGRIALSSEGGPLGGAASLQILQCPAIPTASGTGPAGY